MNRHTNFSAMEPTLDFVRNECGGSTSEPTIESIKAKMRSATIIGSVGYRLGSISGLANGTPWLLMR